MPRLRRVARLCSRTVSSTAYRFRHGSTLCSPTEEKILCRSPYFGAVAGLWSAPDYLIRERQEFKEEGKPQVSLPFCPRRGCGSLPRSAERNSLLRFSEKLSARWGEPPARFKYPAQPVQKKVPPGKGRTHLRSSRTPAIRCQECPTALLF